MSSPAQPSERAALLGAAAPAPAPSAPPADEPPRKLSGAATAWLVFAAVCVFLSIVCSPYPVSMFFLFLVAVAPTLAAFYAIYKYLPDEAVTLSFLITTFFLMAVPAQIVVVIVQVISVVISVLVVFGSMLGPLAEEFGPRLQALGDRYPDMDSLTRDQRRALAASLGEIWREVRAEIPFLRMALFVLVCAFVVSALWEQLGVYVVSRRHRGLSQRGIGARGVVACTTAAALGLVAAQHKSSVAGSLSEIGFLRAFGLALVRMCVAYPLHLGTGLYMGSSMARFFVLKEDISALRTIGVPVLFQGAIYFVGALAMVYRDNMPFLFYLSIPYTIAVLVYLVKVACDNCSDVIRLDDDTRVEGPPAAGGQFGSVASV